MLAAVLAAVTAAAAGCAGGSSASADPPALTKARAQQVLASFAAGANQAGPRLDRKKLPRIEANPQLKMDVASFKLRRAIGQRPDPVAFTRPAFYIPRLHGYPHWFAADAVTGTGDRAVRHALLFTQTKPGAPWLLAADPYPQDAALSRIALDSDGYATAVDPGAKGLAITPARLPAAHAALLTRGPGAPGASTLAEGPRTHRAYRALRQGESTLAKQGVTLSSRFSTTSYAIHALRTRGGGALVWYVLKQNEAYSASQRGRLAVSGDLVGLAPATAAKNRMDTIVLVQYLATVPPKGRATVTGMYRKAVVARGS
ncbi:hypothetical protein [Actinomadura fibrosa]|uniref:DUF8094 domain-containing protein n=1 Tax=Actinomadura fibrosa TaxID=111802 RepID=A0ABW2XIY6_9ACTN|nr:hypothetical protein [Actinomadura fibrosa]